jgi:translation initiation factor IF-3
LSKDKLRVNQDIQARRVLLIDEEGVKLGEFQKNDALSMTEERGYDLVEVGQSDGKSICKMMDHGKFVYDQKKKNKNNKSSTTKVKEIRLRPMTDEKDLMTLVNRARKFLTSGNRVKVTVRFKGRESQHLNLVRDQCKNVYLKLDDIAEIESEPRFAGRQMMMMLVPRKVAIMREVEEPTE